MADNQPTPPSPFPSLGIKMNSLQQFIRDRGGRESLTGLTTNELCESFIKPMTLAIQSSYCEMLQLFFPEQVGEANVFISHVHSSQFLDVVDSLEEHFAKTTHNDNTQKIADSECNTEEIKEHEENDMIIWFDIFSLNQHQQVTEMKNWSTSLESLITSLGRTVMVFCPKSEPLPFQRAWILWELYLTFKTKSRFEIAMTEPSKEFFLEDYLKKTCSQTDFDFNSIRVENSGSQLPTEKEKILSLVKRSVGEAAEFNKLIVAGYKSCLAELLEEEAAKFTETTKTLSEIPEEQLLYHSNRLFALSMLYLDIEKYDNSERLLKQCYKIYKDLSKENHPGALQLLHYTGLVHLKKNNRPMCEIYFNKCFKTRKEVLGETHNDTLQTMTHLANIYSQQEKYDLAESLYKECYAIRKNLTPGPDHPDLLLDTLQTMHNLAGVYFKQSRLNESERMYVRALKYSQEHWGVKHPNGFFILDYLGGIYFSLGKYSQSKTMFEKCFEYRKEALGSSHPHTIYSAQRLERSQQQLRAAGIR